MGFAALNPSYEAHSSSLLDLLLGRTIRAQGVDRKEIPLVDEHCRMRPSGAERAAAERVDGVLVAVLGVYGLAAAEVERLAAGADLLPGQADEMHFDAALIGVVAGAMAETGEVEPAAEVTIDAREQIEIERGRHTRFVVIRGREHVGILDEIDADDEQRVRPQQG